MSLRSKPARDRILAAARRVFAKSGFERATLRRIAADAEVMPSMIIRYYGGKEGLFAAAVDLDLRLPDLAGLSADQAGIGLVRHFVGRWGDPGECNDLAMLMRASFSHPGARTRMHSIFETQLVSAVTPICGTERSSASAALIASQMLGLAYTRFILELPAALRLEPEIIEEQVGRTVAFYLSLPPG